MGKQTANTILMIEPVAFGYNEQTAKNNYFQKRDSEQTNVIQDNALREFREMKEKLLSKGINLIIVKDTIEPHTPDSIFPNNWISFHEDGTLGLYPMCAENRRKERRSDILHQMVKDGFRILDIYDYTESEKENKFLEGTGSMILDRENKIAYAAISDRTDKNLFIRFCKDLGYTPVYFRANQTVGEKRLPIYHTNVMMCVGDKYAVVCLSSIDDTNEKKEIIDSLKKTGKVIVDITEDQMHNFAGNMLQIENIDGEKYLVMSQTAFDSLNEEQIKTLASFNEIVPVNIPTIEKYGGGSARCMMAEVFNPRNN